MSTSPRPTTCFRLDRARLAAWVIEAEDELSGLDVDDEDGPAAAVSSRFADARAAGAIDGPEDTVVNVYPVRAEGLIVAVREAELPAAMRWPMRQVATFGFEVEEVARHGDASFEGCCDALAELLDRAGRLLPELQALRTARPRR
jgi:hypothetical protein